MDSPDFSALRIAIDLVESGGMADEAAILRFLVARAEREESPWIGIEDALPIESMTCLTHRPWEFRVSTWMARHHRWLTPYDTVVRQFQPTHWMPIPSLMNVGRSSIVDGLPLIPGWPIMTVDPKLLELHNAAITDPAARPIVADWLEQRGFDAAAAVMRDHPGRMAYLYGTPIDDSIPMYDRWLNYDGSSILVWSALFHRPSIGPIVGLGVRLSSSHNTNVRDWARRHGWFPPESR